MTSRIARCADDTHSLRHAAGIKLWDDRAKVRPSNDAQQRIALLAMCALYYVLLNVSYSVVESAIDYRAFHYNPPPIGFQLLGLGISLVPCIWLRMSLKNPSDVTLWILYLSLFVPTTFVPYHVLDLEPGVVVRLPVVLLCLFLLLQWICTFSLFRLPSISISRHLVYTALLVISVVLILATIFTPGFQWSLSLSDAYDRRFAARDVITAGSLIAYAVGTLNSSLAPAMVAIGLTGRNIAILFPGVIGLLCVFSLQGSKTSLFAPVFLLLLVIIIQRSPRRFGLTIVTGTVCIVGASMLYYLVFDRYDLSRHIVRRELMVPSVATSFYWDFFSTNPHFYYSDGFLRELIQRPSYEAPMARIIGATYYGGSYETNFNGNLWASAFGQLGYLGMIIVTLAFGLLLRLLDELGAMGDFHVTCAMCGWYALRWSNTALETSMLSGGLVFTLLILYLLPRSRQSEEREQKPHLEAEF